MDTILLNSGMHKFKPLFYNLWIFLFCRWYEILRLYLVRSAGWRLINLYAQLTPITEVGSFVRAYSRICVIPRRNCGRIEKPRLSASNRRLARTSSSRAVNLWLLARVSARGLIPRSRFSSGCFDLNCPFLYADMAICIRFSLDSSIFNNSGKEITY
jgi:hypothetical protein